MADPMDHPSFPRPKATPLRFKATIDTAKQRERDTRYDTHRRRHHKHRHRQSNHDGHSNADARPKPEDDANPQYPDSEAAFRESLFDAMADDEGADYWESVYGQPVHSFPQERVGADGKLERMTEEEYVEFVRAEMWKKTNAGFLEEKDRRANARKQAAEQDREAKEIRERMAREDSDFQQRVNESLRKGRHREERRRNRVAWEEYQRGWDKLGMDVKQNDAIHIPWPILDQYQEANLQSIEAFIKYATDVGKDEGLSFVNVLKAERVRWHPDKVQQRAKGKLGEETVKKVTAVFQIIDDLWMKHKKS